MCERLYYITNVHGARTAVVLPISQYEKLLEDVGDLAAIAERRDEPITPHHQIIAELNRDGFI